MKTQFILALVSISFALPALAEPVMDSNWIDVTGIQTRTKVITSIPYSPYASPNDIRNAAIPLYYQAERLCQASPGVIQYRYYVDNNPSTLTLTAYCVIRQL